MKGYLTKIAVVVNAAEVVGSNPAERFSFYHSVVLSYSGATLLLFLEA